MSQKTKGIHSELFNSYIRVSSQTPKYLKSQKYIDSNIFDYLVPRASSMMEASVSQESNTQETVHELSSDEDYVTKSASLSTSQKELKNRMRCIIPKKFIYGTDCAVSLDHAMPPKLSAHDTVSAKQARKLIMFAKNKISKMFCHIVAYAEFKCYFLDTETSLNDFIPNPYDIVTQFTIVLVELLKENRCKNIDHQQVFNRISTTLKTNRHNKKNSGFLTFNDFTFYVLTL